MAKERKSMWYSAWSWILKRFLEVFFRRIEVQGLENIPKDKPVIFASNHTNALIDALVIAYFSGKQHYFMTRGDVFKQKIIGALFRSWRMLPMYRMKDGIDTISQNNPVMDFVVKELAKGQSMIIFPEGTHSWERKIQPLKKGLIRMAYDVLERNPESELVIIPVGLYFNDMRRVNQDVLVNFGKPLSVRDFPLEENKQKTYIKFNSVLRRQMESQIVNLPFEGELYERVEAWRIELAQRLIGLSVTDSFAHQQEFIELLMRTDLPAMVENNQEINLDTVLASEGLNAWWRGVSHNLPQPVSLSQLAYFIKWPFYMISFLQFAPLFFLCRKILAGIKDYTFHNSVKFGLGLIIMPIFAILQGLILALVLGNWLVLPIYLFAMPGWATLFAEWRGLQRFTDYR